LCDSIANMAKKKGFRSVNDGKAWRCRCGVVNQPTKHRFFNLPAFQCSQCQRKLKLDFKFCFGEVKANGKSVVGEVWDQDKDREFLFRTEVFVSARKNKLKFCSLVFWNKSWIEWGLCHTPNCTWLWRILVVCKMDHIKWLEPDSNLDQTLLEPDSNLDQTLLKSWLHETKGEGIWK